MRELADWVVTYLLNAVWQVPLVFGTAWLSARLLARVGARAEHRMWVGALIAAVMLPACRLRLAGLLPISAGAGAGGSVTARVSPIGAVSGLGGAMRLPAWAVDVVLVVYGCALLFFAARLAWGVWKTRRIAGQASAVSPEGGLAASWERYCGRLSARDARIYCSRAVSGPVVVGFRAPMLLVPEGFLESVSEADWEAALAHEFAHIERRDFAKSVAYGVLSLPVAWHPVARLVAARIAESREVVCDEMAAEAAQGRKEYAHSLLRLAQMLVDGPRREPLHAIGIFDGNTLERRVMTLLRKPVEMRKARRLVSVAACVALGLTACGSALALRMRVDGAAVAAPTVNPDQAKKDATSAPLHVKIASVQVLYKKNPVYPPDAKKNPVNGVVVLRTIINESGVPEDVQVVKSLRADYDQSAVDAVREWRYSPYLLNGVPTKVEANIQINYQIK